MENKYCINCMKQLGDSPVCRHCGWDNSKPHQAEPYHLTPGTLLAGRYLVGKALGEGGFGITYIGLHTTLSKRVAIKEFYPAGAANRTSQISEEIIITKDKQDFFRKGVERFLNEAKNVASFPTNFTLKACFPSTNKSLFRISPFVANNCAKTIKP